MSMFSSHVSFRLRFSLQNGIDMLSEDMVVFVDCDLLQTKKSWKSNENLRWTWFKASYKHSIHMIRPRIVVACPHFSGCGEEVVIRALRPLPRWWRKNNTKIECFFFVCDASRVTFCPQPMTFNRCKWMAEFTVGNFTDSLVSDAVLCRFTICIFYVFVHPIKLQLHTSRHQFIAVKLTKCMHAIYLPQNFHMRDKHLTDLSLRRWREYVVWRRHSLFAPPILAVSVGARTERSISAAAKPKMFEVAREFLLIIYAISHTFILRRILFRSLVP